MNYLQLLQLGAPEALVTFTALALLTLGLTSRCTARLCTFVAALGLALAAAAVCMLPPNASPFAGMLVISPLNSLFKLISLALAFFAIALADSDRRRANHAEYLALLLFATLGLLLLVGSEELLMIFIGLELTGLTLYVLVGFDRDEPRAAEAALKYFLFGSTASAFTLFGLSFIYGICRGTDLATIAHALADKNPPPLLLAGLVMTLAGFAFKIAAAPFHLWAPDAYQTAPASSAAFIASGSKVATFVVLGKFLFSGFAWTPLFAVLAVLSIVVGNFAALAQTNVRRLLAYSAVAHAGYTLLGLVGGGRDGFSATLFYTTIYGFTLIGAFGVVALVKRMTGGDDLENFAGLSKRSPLLAGCTAIFILSLAGLPPLPGFFGKFYLFSAVLRGQNQFSIWLVAIALFGSLVSLYYYLLILRAVFSKEIAPLQAQSTIGLTSPALPKLIVAVLALLVLFCGILPTTLLEKIIAAL